MYVTRSNINGKYYIIVSTIYIERVIQNITRVRQVAVDGAVSWTSRNNEP